MSKFKIGEWVEAPDDHPFCAPTQIFCIEERNLDFANKEGRKWKPKPGDWCWFYNQNNTTAIVGKFRASYKDGKYAISTGEIFSNCEPFLKSLPKSLINRY